MGLCQVEPDIAKAYKHGAVFPWLDSVALFPVLSPFQVRPCPRSGDSVREPAKDQHPSLWYSSEIPKLAANDMSQGTLQLQLPMNKSVHSFSTSTFIYHTVFHHLILFVE